MAPDKRLLVCGSRYWTDARPIRDFLLTERPQVVIVGGARGADKLAAEIAIDLKMSTLVFPAEWGRYGKRAGPIRNKRMLEEGKPTMVLGLAINFTDPHSGTRNMCQIATKAGVPTILVEQREAEDGTLYRYRNLTLADFKEETEV